MQAGYRVLGVDKQRLQDAEHGGWVGLQAAVAQVLQAPAKPRRLSARPLRCAPPTARPADEGLGAAYAHVVLDISAEAGFVPKAVHQHFGPDAAIHCLINNVRPAGGFSAVQGRAGCCLPCGAGGAPA